MKSVFLLVLLMAAAPAFSQETRLVTRSVKSTPYNSETEKFEVLKAALNIRHGTYRHQIRGHVVETGFYRTNQRDSLWTTFYFRDNQVKSRGHYRNDHKTGVWTYFDEKGKSKAQFDFSAGRWVDSLAAVSDSSLVRFVVGSDTLMASSPYPATFAGGKQSFSDFLIHTIIFPADAMRSGLAGRINVGFWIDEEGRVSDIRPVAGGRTGPLVKEAIRIIEYSDRQWIPAQYRGRAVRSYFTVPITFESVGNSNSR